MPTWRDARGQHRYGADALRCRDSVAEFRALSPTRRVISAAFPAGLSKKGPILHLRFIFSEILFHFF